MLSVNHFNFYMSLFIIVLFQNVVSLDQIFFEEANKSCFISLSEIDNYYQNWMLVVLNFQIYYFCHFA